MPSSTARFVAATRLGHVRASAPAPEPRDADWSLAAEAPQERSSPAGQPEPTPRERASLRRLLAWTRLVRA